MLEQSRDHAETDSAPEQEPSFIELLGDLTTEVGSLVRQEVALAADEMTQKARRAVRSVIVIGAGGLLCAASLLVLAGALVLALASVLPMWASAFVIAAGIGVAGYMAVRRGAAALRSIELVPTELVASLKDDEAWARQQIDATRDQMSTTFGEIRHRLQPPPPKPKRIRAPAKRAKPTQGA